MRMFGRLQRNVILLTCLIFPGISICQSDIPRLAASGEFNSIMATYATINWVNDLNPRYVNLDNDQFLLETKNGVVFWDVPSNKFSSPSSLPNVGIPNHLSNTPDYNNQNLARLGNKPSGTALISVNPKGGATHELLWWNGQKRQLDAALPLDRGAPVPALLALDQRHLLLCFWGKNGKVARLDQMGDAQNLRWVAANDPDARTALLAAGIIGVVEGFGVLEKDSTNPPVYFDISHCGWEIASPPKEIAAFLNKSTRRHPPEIKPYFLKDGRILLNEVKYFDEHEFRVRIKRPLVWHPQTSSWIGIEPTINGGSEIHYAGIHEPVISQSFHSRIIEFLDTKSMHWQRSKQLLPEDQSIPSIEPLSIGALVFLQRTGEVGIVTPMTDAIPVGKSGLVQYGYQGETVLKGGGVFLIGDGEGETNTPNVRCEIIDGNAGQAREIATLPIQLGVPHGMELIDGSILLVGGLPPGCVSSNYFSSSKIPYCTNPQSSYRYFPSTNVWQEIQELRIPFTRGYSWQTGNSGQWTRSDSLVRQNGEVAWIEGGEIFQSDLLVPQSSSLKQWSPKGGKPSDISVLRRARSQSSLIELSDGRLVVAGGEAQREIVALEKNCFECPDDFVSIGPFVAARSTEILAESPQRTRWATGPQANYGGGRAFKLADERIFKLSTEEYSYKAEIADAGFTKWEVLPPFPLTNVKIRNLSAVANRIIILTETNKTVVWDDSKQQWQVWTDWPTGAGKDRRDFYTGNKEGPPLSVTPANEKGLVLVRYAKVFETVKLPASEH